MKLAGELNDSRIPGTGMGEAPTGAPRERRQHAGWPGRTGTRWDTVAFGELVDLGGDLCYAIAYRILRDAERAEDAVQQAYLLAWRDLRTLRDPDRFDAWLHRLLVNACYAEIRRHRRWSGRIHALPDELSGGLDPNVLSVDDRDALERAFRRLSPEQRAVFVGP
jgi:RNA polymerase sigma-70 factor, ECF subfamily